MKLDEHINKYYHNLSENDLYIWRYIKSNREACKSLTITELSSRCHVSRTTLSRFVHKIGFNGFSEFKVTLIQDSQTPKEDYTSMKKVISLYNEVVHRIVEQNCDKIFELIDSAENLYIYSSGILQSTVAHEMTRIFVSAKRIFYEVSGKAETNRMIEKITPGDVMFMVSYSGESPEVVEFARALKIRNVPVVSITTLHENELAKLSTVNLYTSGLVIKKDDLDVSYTSVTSFFILIEMLFLKYLEYRSRKEQ